jgi:hypothetical protein
MHTRKQDVKEAGNKDMGRLLRISKYIKIRASENIYRCPYHGSSTNKSVTVTAERIRCGWCGRGYDAFSLYAQAQGPGFTLSDAVVDIVWIFGTESPLLPDGYSGKNWESLLFKMQQAETWRAGLLGLSASEMTSSERRHVENLPALDLLNQHEAAMSAEGRR